MFRVALVAALLLVAVPATAQASWELTPDGQPRISTNREIPGDLELSVCPPDGSACTPAAWTNDPIHVAVYEPGETPVGTTFVIRRTSSGAEERSPAWQGRLVATAPPSYSGSAFTTNHVTPVDAKWTGGWGNETSKAYLIACTTPQATDCVNLPPARICPVPCTVTPEGPSGLAYSEPAALPPVLAGSYLLAIESRMPADQRGFPARTLVLPGWSFLYRFPAVLRDDWGVTTNGTPVAIAPTAIDPPLAGAPTVKLRERALRTKGKLSVGRITCAAEACKVSLKVSGGGKKAATTTFLAKRGTTALKTAVRRGKLTVRVHVDGKLLANGKLKA